MTIVNDVLITAFEPYWDYDYNPSKALLQTHPPFRSVDIGRVVLPVDPERGWATLKPHLTNRLSAVLMLGLTMQAEAFVFEQYAQNLYRSEVDQPAEPVVKDSLPHYRATLGYGPLFARLRRFDVPARLSNYAGDFVCNALFYRTLHWARATEQQPSVGLVHIPPFEGRPLGELEGPTKTRHHWVLRSALSNINRP